jgi:hypothetical protein
MQVYTFNISPAANSVYNQLLGIKLRTVSLWVALVYLDSESLWQRNWSYTRTLCTITKIETMKVSRKKIVTIFIFALLFVCFIFFQNYNTKKIAIRGYSTFYHKSINGKLTSVSFSGGLDFFKINDIGEKYVITAIPQQINSTMLFYNTAQIGDSIFKIQNTDTFRLVKNGRVYHYTCFKY